MRRSADASMIATGAPLDRMCVAAVPLRLSPVVGETGSAGVVAARGSLRCFMGAPVCLGAFRANVGATLGAGLPPAE